VPITASSLYGRTTVLRPIDNLYGSGAKAYGDASGANGVAGLQSAMDTFKNSGQYGAITASALDQGLQALNRTHAAAGNLSSGNADTDTMNFATGLAGQQYNNYLQGLSPYLALNGQAQALATNGQATAATGLGTGLNASYTGQGGAANTTQTTIGNNDAGAEMNNYKIGANQLNALTGAASWLSGSGPTNLANGAKSLFSAFG
jgi:hypothetical protein